MPKTQEAHVIKTTGPIYADRDGTRITLQKNDPIYEDDIITTGPNTTTDILYRDGAKARIAPDTQFTLVDFEFGSGDDAPSFFINLAHGAMRTVSGEIVKLNPEAFEIQTPRATVGIRGTEFYTSVEPDTGNETYVVLYMSKGSKMIIKQDGGESVELTNSKQHAGIGKSGVLHINDISPAEILRRIEEFSPTLSGGFPENVNEQGAWESLGENTSVYDVTTNILNNNLDAATTTLASSGAILNESPSAKGAGNQNAGKQNAGNQNDSKQNAGNQNADAIVFTHDEINALISNYSTHEVLMLSNDRDQIEANELLLCQNYLNLGADA